MTPGGTTRVVGVWKLGYRGGAWWLQVVCPCGVVHDVGSGGNGPAPQLRGAVLSAPACHSGMYRPGELVTVTPRLNPEAGRQIELAREKVEEAAGALLAASDVLERRVERDELRRLSRELMATSGGRLLLIQQLQTLHPDDVAANLAGAST